MYAHERSVLTRIADKLKEQFAGRISAVYVFGSRARGDHGVWSDLDVLILVTDKSPEIETGIISLFVDEEIQSNTSFSPVIKDIEDFEREKNFNSPFYENILREGVLL